MMFRPSKKPLGTERKRPASMSARIWRPTSISMPLSSKGTVSETRRVSPIPRGMSCSKAMRVLMTPSGGMPASVTPRCRGTSGRSAAKRSLASTTSRGSESLIDTQKSWKPSSSRIAQWSTAWATSAATWSLPKRSL